MSKTYSMIFITILISALALVQSTKAQSTTTLSVEPRTIDPTLIPGDTFTVNCSVTNVTDLYAWQVWLFFDQTILNCTAASYPSGHIFEGKTIIPLAPEIDNEVGSVLYGASLMLEPKGVDGDGVLCQINFTVIGVGETALTYSEYGKATDTYLLNMAQELIPVSEIRNGYFNNTRDVAITSLLPSGTMIELGDPVSVDITVENQGIATESFNVSVYFNTTTVATETVTSLLANTSKTLTFVCRTEDLEKGNYTISAGATPVPYETDIDDNTFTDGTITIIAYHDVAVTDVIPSKTLVVQGSSVSIYVTVENQGHYTETFNTTVYYDTNHIETQELTLNSKDSRTMTFIWNTTGVPIGNYTISAEASEVPDEMDTTDNTFLDGIVSVITPLPADIEITDVKPIKDVVAQGYSLSINVTVANEGDMTETFNVTLYWNTTEIDTEEITLASGGNTTITFYWNTTGLTEYKNYRISAYAHPIPGEVDTGDNSFIDGIVFVVHVGDVIIDERVRVDDILAVALKFGSNLGDQDWDPLTDINCDGQVRVDDILITALEFGWTKP